jgi:hypothetical protein
MTTVCDDIKAARSELQRLGTNRQWRRAPKQVLEAGQGSLYFSYPFLASHDPRRLRNADPWCVAAVDVGLADPGAPTRGHTRAVGEQPSARCVVGLSGHTPISTASPPRGINAFHNGLGLPVFAARNSSQYQDEPSSWRARGIATASGPE